MLETLSKMSGIRHRTYKDTKTITQDSKAILKMAKTEGKISITLNTKEEPVISYNDMAFIPERNSIVFRAGDSPIWNKNETILPMSWRLFKNTIIQPGKEYSLQTIPTLSTAIDFDVRKNQPNFQAMLEKRMAQAALSLKAQEIYKDAYGYSDYEIAQLDPDNYSDEIMDLIYSTLNPEEAKQAIEAEAAGRESDVPDASEYEEMFDYIFGNTGKKNEKYTGRKKRFDEFETITDNEEQLQATAEVAHKHAEDSILRYAGGTISRDMLISPTGVNRSLNVAIAKVYERIKDEMDADSHFTFKDGVLYGARDGKVYIKVPEGRKPDMEALNEAAKQPESRVYSESEVTEEDAEKFGSYVVTDDFLRYLTTFQSAWPFADGKFEAMMFDEMAGNEN